VPRVPYKPHDLAEPKDLIDSIRARRGGNLLNLDRVLLHSPPFARGWNAFLREVRATLALPPKLRELAMCAVAVLNGAEYEFHHHAPELLKAGGTAIQLEALRRLGASPLDADAFDPTEQAVLQLTVEMTRNVQVTDGTFSAARSVLLDDRQMVELVGVISAYNMVSRFLVALQIEGV
jgi:AhpD family alkylhydroperoxidase